ncbi:MAG: hypothetical protein LRY42_03090, partial [Candidatus Pacebacteria bacterium]|nr:hypothetical protein [Candidatus Paceibacterota bacterium]
LTIPAFWYIVQTKNFRFIAAAIIVLNFLALFHIFGMWVWVRFLLSIEQSAFLYFFFVGVGGVVFTLLFPRVDGLEKIDVFIEHMNNRKTNN